MSPRSIPDPVRSRRPARAAFAIACIVTMAALNSCAPKITKVDTSYSLPEGVTSSNATLLVWQDQPSLVYSYLDRAPVDPDDGDTLIDVEVHQRYDARTLHGMIIDHTQADAFQLFRRESGGGVRQWANYTLKPARQWLASQYEAYHFIDASPSRYLPSTYVCRGIVEGVVNGISPLTNLASPNPASPANISLRAVWWNNREPLAGPVFRGPKIKLRWDPVPGAVRYLVQVFQFRSDLRSVEERILSGTPAPLYDGQSTDIYLGYVPGNINFFFVGDSTRSDLTTIQARPIDGGATLIARMTALDASDRIIGMTLGEANILDAYTNGNAGIQRSESGATGYKLYRYSGAAVRDTVVVAPGGGGGNS